MALAALCGIMFCTPARSQSQDVQIPQPVRALAAAAKDAFRDRMEPPFARLALLNFADGKRDLYSILRDYARNRFDAAIDSLAAEAAAPERAASVEEALRIFVQADRASAADAIFANLIQRKAQDARQSASALRDSVALLELPAALAAMIKPPYEPLPIFPLGQRTLPTYRHAAELDPDDPWTWIVIALLGRDAALIDSAIRNAERSAAAINDWRARAFAKQISGAYFELRGQSAEAEQLYSDALLLARQRSALAGREGREELARDLVWFGATQGKWQRMTEARAAFEEALSIRKELMAGAPDSARARRDLMASYTELFALLVAAGKKDEANVFFNEGMRVYNAAVEGSAFVPPFVPSTTGVVLAVILPAGGLTLILGPLILIVYRRCIMRLMRATAGLSGSAAIRSSTTHSGGHLAEIPIRLADAAGWRRPTTHLSEPIVRADSALRKTAAIHAVAGCAFAAVATALWFHFSTLEIGSNVAPVLLGWLWPLVPVGTLLWGGDRRRLLQLLTLYLAAWLVVCSRAALSDIQPLQLHGVRVASFFQPVVYAALTFLPTLFLLLFLNRRIRAIGPVLLTFMICVLFGAQSAYVVLGVPAVMKAVVSFTFRMPTAIVYWGLTPLVGMALFAPLAWIVIGIIRRCYQAKRFSEQMVVFDSIWLFQTVLLCGGLFFDAGYRGLAGIAAFAAYKLVVWIGLRPVARAAAQGLPARLLLLRVFGFRRRSERLFDLLAARWRYAGPIGLIAAPDIAGHSIDPAKLLEFVSGGLRRRFIIEPADLDRRLAALDDRPDPDGRFRINELFCGNDAWQDAVRGLMAKCDLVAMDLRGFSPNSRGCTTELQLLIDLVSLGRTVLLIDASTDVPFLRRTLSQCWNAMADASPNRSVSGGLTLLNVGNRDAQAVQTLLTLADRTLAQSGQRETQRQTRQSVRTDAAPPPRALGPGASAVDVLPS